MKLEAGDRIYYKDGKQTYYMDLIRVIGHEQDEEVDWYFLLPGIDNLYQKNILFEVEELASVGYLEWGHPIPYIWEQLYCEKAFPWQKQS